MYYVILLLTIAMSAPTAELVQSFWDEARRTGVLAGLCDTEVEIMFNFYRNGGRLASSKECGFECKCAMAGFDPATSCFYPARPVDDTCDTKPAREIPLSNA